MTKRFFSGLIFSMLILMAYAGCTICPDPLVHVSNGSGNGGSLTAPYQHIEENWVPLTITAYAR